MNWQKDKHSEDRRYIDDDNGRVVGMVRDVGFGGFHAEISLMRLDHTLQTVNLGYYETSLHAMIAVTEIVDAYKADQ